MDRPPDLAEQDVLDAAEHAVRTLAHRFTIPGHDADDVAQQARLFALECLPRYDPAPDSEGRPTRPLVNLVMRHVRFRLINWRRDVHRRADAPCLQCYTGQPCGPDGRVCPKYAGWAKRQEAKSRVNRPVPLDGVGEDEGLHPAVPSTVEADAEVREVLALIDEHLDVELRATYLRMRAGRPVEKHRRAAVEEAVKEILGPAVL